MFSKHLPDTYRDRDVKLKKCNSEFALRRRSNRRAINLLICPTIVSRLKTTHHFTALQVQKNTNDLTKTHSRSKRFCFKMSERKAFKMFAISKGIAQPHLNQPFIVVLKSKVSPSISERN